MSFMTSTKTWFWGRYASTIGPSVFSVATGAVGRQEAVVVVHVAEALSAVTFAIRARAKTIGDKIRRNAVEGAHRKPRVTYSRKCSQLIYRLLCD
jgi:hypothetical protein